MGGGSASGSGSSDCGVGIGVGLGEARMDRLLRRVRSNVKANVGMSNDAVEGLCRQLCSDSFMGVYSADKIPSNKLAKLDNFIIVVNLGTSDMPVGHFVTLSADPSDKSVVSYMDSFALPCFQPHVRDFVRKCGREVRLANKRRIQAVSSVYCGLYASLFAVYQDRKPDFELEFSRKDYESNDDRCVKYLRKIIREM